MKIRVQVDQAAALRRGVNAPTSVTDIEFDPVTITPENREKIAARLKGGIEVHDGYHLLTVDEPTVAGVIAAIDLIEEEKAAEKQKEVDFFAEVELARPAFIKGLVIEKDGIGRWQLKEPEVSWRIREQLTGDSRYQEKKHECERLQEQQRKAGIEERERKNQEEDAKLRAIVGRLGSDMDKERVQRGYVKGYSLLRLVEELLTEQAFTDCPLPPLEAPSAEELDMSDYNEDDHYGEAELPKLMEFSQELEPEKITNDLMKRIVNAEKTLKAWRPDAKFTPWVKSITRRDDDIPWVDRYGLKVTLQEEGISVSDIVKLSDVIKS